MNQKLIKAFLCCTLAISSIVFLSCSHKDSVNEGTAIDNHNGTDAERRYNDSVNMLGDSSRWLHEDTMHSGPNRSE